MKSWRNCNAQKQDEAALDTSYIPTIMQESGASHLDETDRPSGTRPEPYGTFTSVKQKIRFVIFGTENGKTEKVDKMLKLKESGPSFHNQNYVETIEEFQSYVDMVKRLTRPGCSVETLDVALSSVSSLMNTLSAISPKEQIIHSSL